MELPPNPLSVSWELEGADLEGVQEDRWRRIAESALKGDRLVPHGTAWRITASDGELGGSATVEAREGTNESFVTVTLLR